MKKIINNIFYIILAIACGYFISTKIHISKLFPEKSSQQKVFELANEMKHENKNAAVVLFGLSAAMCIQDEDQLADIVAVYAFRMKDSLENLHHQKFQHTPAPPRDPIAPNMQHALLSDFEFRISDFQ